MIELVTGLPGSGKTLQTIWRTKAKAEKEGRAVYYSGITDLTLPWIEWDAEKWMDIPANSIFVMDEAQRKFRPRGRTGEPPPYVSGLETHRHLGIDIVFITQNPMLIDSHVRNLCDRHWHVMRKFGTKFATIYEYTTGVNANVATSRGKGGFVRHEWRYPKEVFGYYKSAEVHTGKARVPMKVWVFLAMPLVFATFAYLAWNRLSPEAKRKQAEEKIAADRAARGLPATGAGGSQQARVSRNANDVLTPAQYVERQQPRVPGLAYTAPAFDEVTKPTQAPYPAACIASITRCVCASQQGTKLEVPDSLCRSIADGGFFVAWGQPAAQAVPLQRKEPDVIPVAAGPGSLGGTGYGLAERSGAAPTVGGSKAGTPGEAQDSARPRARGGIQG